MRYAIEARQLTRESKYRPKAVDPRRTTIEARDADDAISQFLRTDAAELVSVTRPSKGSESIATVKKDDSMYLVRVYAI